MAAEPQQKAQELLNLSGSHAGYDGYFGVVFGGGAGG